MVLVLMPGMDGTGLLFRALREALPDTLRTLVVEYPRDEVLGYDALLKRVTLPDEPFVIVAESFSGPLAVRLAARGLPQLRGLVLAASFVRSPRRLPRALLSPLFFRVPPPDAVLRFALLGADTSTAELRTALRSVDARVLAQRLAEIVTVDVSEELARCPVPVLSIVATRDRLVPRSSSEALRQVLPRVEQLALNAPHLVLQTRAREAAAAITNFVERLTPR